MTCPVNSGTGTQSLAFRLQSPRHVRCPERPSAHFMASGDLQKTCHMGRGFQRMEPSRGFWARSGENWILSPALSLTLKDCNEKVHWSLVEERVLQGCRRAARHVCARHLPAPVQMIFKSLPALTHGADSAKLAMKIQSYHGVHWQ